ncbi:MAG: beta-ketoacyl synthase N-terminal-like domain-containing protein, partial [Actinomyces sp.]
MPGYRNPRLAVPSRTGASSATDSRIAVITGFGALTPLGVDASSTWEAMLAGRSGVHTLPYEWAQPLPVTFAAEAAGDPAEKIDRVAA